MFTSSAIRRKVREVVKVEVAKMVATAYERLETMVPQCMAEALAEHPDRDLSEAGFMWVMSLEVQQRMPGTTLGDAFKLSWDYLDIAQLAYGQEGHDWTANGARGLAETLVEELEGVA